MDENDDFPKQICHECLGKLKNFYRLYRQIEKTNETLRSVKKNSVSSSSHECNDIQPTPGKVTIKLIEKKWQLLTVDSNSDKEIEVASNEEAECNMCIVCKREFSTNGRLQLHLTKKHYVRSDMGIVKQYQCDKCEKSYTTIANLTIHKKSHSGINDSINSITQMLWKKIKILLFISDYLKRHQTIRVRSMWKSIL